MLLSGVPGSIRALGDVALAKTHSKYLPWWLEGPHMMWELAARGSSSGVGAAAFHETHVQSMIDIVSGAMALARRVRRTAILLSKLNKLLLVL